MIVVSAAAAEQKPDKFDIYLKDEELVQGDFFTLVCYYKYDFKVTINLNRHVQWYVETFNYSYSVEGWFEVIDSPDGKPVMESHLWQVMRVEPSIFATKFKCAYETNVVQFQLSPTDYTYVLVPNTFPDNTYAAYYVREYKGVCDTKYFTSYHLIPGNKCKSKMKIRLKMTVGNTIPECRFYNGK